MAEERGGGDRSMEDILASIREIISDDGKVSGGRDRGVRNDATQVPPSESGRSDNLLRSASAGLEIETEAPEAEGDHDDDLSDIVEMNSVPSTAASRRAAEVEGASPSETDPPTPSAAWAALDRVAGGDGEQWSRPMRVSSLTERLSLRERMASLDFKQNSDVGGPQNDVQPVARREVASEPRPAAGPETVARATDAADADGRSDGRSSPGTPTPGEVGPAVPPQEVGDRLTDEVATGAARSPLPAVKTTVSAPQVQPAAPKAGAVETSSLDKTSAAGMAHGWAASVVATKDEDVIGLAPNDLGDVSEDDPFSGAQAVGRDGHPKGSGEKIDGDQPAVIRGVMGQPVQPGGRSVGGESASQVAPNAKAGAGLAAPSGARADAAREEKTETIPSSTALDVSALNEAGRRPDEGHTPSAELVEAARDALHVADSDASAAEAAGAAAASPSLEEVVRDALQPVLKKWLDENLPKLIEKQLRDEVERALGKVKRDAAG